MKAKLFLAGALLAPAMLHAASDFQWTFDNTSSFSYTLTTLSSTQVFGGGLPSDDPTINLIVGKRYGVHVVNFAAHPVAIVALGASAAQDVDLLLQGAGVGSLEGDAGIGWTDDGAGNVEFTVTPSLIAAMTVSAHTPGYICDIHPATMRGSFDIFNNGVAIADPIPGSIPKGTVRIELDPVMTAQAAPVGATVPDDGSNRMFVFDQAGLVTVVDAGVPQVTPFLDVSARLVPLTIVLSTNIGYDERGLLGLAAHPNFASNRKIYTYTSEPTAGAADFTVTLPGGRTMDSQSVIAEWQVSAGDPNVIDTATRREIMRIDEPQFNHNGGQMRFGPDGFLYIALGDGGGADDQDGAGFIGPDPIVGHGPDGNAQDTSNVLGTILRIDVDGSNSTNGQYGVPATNPFVGSAGVDEIFAFGFRNPYSFSFDRSTGDLWCGDVGQNDVEEIDIVTSGGNYGWRHKEGSFFFDPNGTADGFVTTVPVSPIPSGVIDPVAEYDHDEGISIIGGFVYRGTAIPDLVGKYVFGDFGASFGAPSGRLFYLDTGNVIKELTIGNDDRTLDLFVKGFGEDSSGELYVMGSTDLAPSGTGGSVLKLVPAPTAGVSPNWNLF
jgi:glucose/arabinose dehydrogenase